MNYRYEFKSSMNDVEAIYFDGTALGAKRIRDFLDVVDPYNVISKISFPDTDLYDYPRGSVVLIRDVKSIARLSAISIMQIHCKNQYIVKPGEMLLFKISQKECKGIPPLVTIGTLPGDIFNLMYRQSK